MAERHLQSKDGTSEPDEGVIVQREVVQSPLMRCALCKSAFKLLDIEAHQAACPERLKVCQFCHKQVRAPVLAEHEVHCSTIVTGSRFKPEKPHAVPRLAAPVDIAAVEDRKSTV